MCATRHRTATFEIIVGGTTGITAIETTATVTLEQQNGGFAITKCHLDTEITVNGGNKEKVLEIFNKVKALERLTNYERDDEAFIELLETARKSGNKSLIRYIMRVARFASRQRCIKVLETLEDLGASKDQMFKVITNLSCSALLIAGMSLDDIIVKIRRNGNEGENIDELWFIFLIVTYDLKGVLKKKRK